MSAHRKTCVDSPLGPITLEFRGAALVSARFDDEREVTGTFAPLERYFAGEVSALDEVEVAPEGTDFQKRVWARLREIPPGETTTYGALADELGSVARAVGGANGANPVVIVVPCHRVVGANGKLTGFLYGVDRKRRLLDLERAKSFSLVG